MRPYSAAALCAFTPAWNGARIVSKSVWLAQTQTRLAGLYVGAF
jgi:hypothetical protein